jgi:hypothetical protein
VRRFALLIGKVMMTPGLVCFPERQPANGVADETIVHMVVSIALAFFIQLGTHRLSRLLDAIAETDYFQELTMID